MKSSPSIWHLLHIVKSTVKISSIFVAFSENMNFTTTGLYLNDFDCKPEAIGMEPFLCLDRLFIMRKFFVMWEGGLKRLWILSHVPTYTFRIFFDKLYIDFFWSSGRLLSFGSS